jgi:molybdate transport system substrate-binding protein
MRRLVAALVAVVAATVACGDESSGAPEPQRLHVYAASSLTAAFEELAAQFEAEHDGVEVALTFAGSSDLVAQVDQGAPADVVASADEATMDKLVRSELVTGPQPFATNVLAIAVPPDNPADVGSMADLGRPGLQLVVCAPEVPCGSAARELATRTGVTLRPVSEEQSVGDVLTKVTSGEADAGLVYVTDLAAAGDDVTGIEVPEAEEVVNVYPVAPVAGSDQADLAQDFVDLVLGDEGQEVLARLGFGPPR